MWFNSLFARSGSARSQSGRRPTSSRLSVEALEDRTVPSALAPTSQPDPVAGIVSSLSASAQQSFQASGSFAHTGNKVGSLSGTATPLGVFSGSFTQDQNGVHQTGTFTLIFDSGSLTCSYQMSLDRATNEFVGTYQIISGTAALADASGGGTIMVDHAAEGSVSLSGTISL
jgi:hypothetical protein